MTEESRRPQPVWKYSFPKDRTAPNHLHIDAHIGYRTHLSVGFDDDGGEGFRLYERLLEDLPRMIEFVRREIAARNQVEDEMANLDAELEQLLNPDGDTE